MKELYLPLKEKWYRMIESGGKKEEYREVNRFWCKRLLGFDTALFSHRNNYESCNVKGYTHAHFTLGYPKRDDESRHMVRRIKEIVIAEGRVEWGAEKGKKYFVIRFE